MSGPANDEAAEYIQKLLDEAPELDDAQRNRLAELLRPVRVRPVVQEAASDAI